MTEMEKMLAGELYCGTDSELMKIWYAAKNMLREYNMLDYADHKGQRNVLNSVDMSLC